MTRRIKLIVTLMILITALFVIKETFWGTHQKSFFMDQETDSSTVNYTESEQKAIVYSYGSSDHGGSVKRTLELFQESNPDIKVKLQQLPGTSDSQYNAYQIALSSGDDSFDVFHADVIWTAQFAFSDWILPLDQFFPPSMHMKFLPNTIESCMYNGKIYAVPNVADVPLLFYRKDIVEKPPKTYAELMTLARKNLSAPGIKYGFIFQASTYEGLVCNVLDFIWNNGGKVLENNKVVINSPEAIEGLQLFIDIIHSDISSPDVLSFQEDDSTVAFQDGSAIFMRNWPYAYKQSNTDHSKIKGKVGIAPLPLGPKGKSHHGTLGGWNYMINRHSKDPALAWEFVEWMSSYEAQVVNSTYGGKLPTRKAVYKNPTIQKLKPWLGGFQNIYEAAQPRPVSPYYASVSESMQTNFSKAIIGKIDAKTAIENIERDMNTLLSIH